MCFMCLLNIAILNTNAAPLALYGYVVPHNANADTMNM